MINQTEEVDPRFLYKIKEYGMGNIRSIEDYFNFTGIDTKKKKISSRCGKKFDNKINQWV